MSGGGNLRNIGDVRLIPFDSVVLDVTDGTFVESGDNVGGGIGGGVDEGGGGGGGGNISVDLRIPDDTEYDLGIGPTCGIIDAGDGGNGGNISFVVNLLYFCIFLSISAKFLRISCVFVVSMLLMNVLPMLSTFLIKICDTGFPFCVFFSRKNGPQKVAKSAPFVDSFSLIVVKSVS